MKARRAVVGGLAAALTLVALALMLAGPAAAHAPIESSWVFAFDDVNPCTGDMHTVTIAGTRSVHDHNGRIVAHDARTITTSPTGSSATGRTRMSSTARSRCSERQTS
jgi:hypothetical protein